MANVPDSRPTPLGIYDRPRAKGITGIEIAAIALSALWLLVAGAFLLFGSSDDDSFGGLRVLLSLMSVFLPVAMVWVAAITVKSSRVMRDESRRIQAATDAMRQAHVAQTQGKGDTGSASIAKKLDEIAAAQRKTDSALAMFTSSREMPRATPGPAPTAPSSAPQADEQGMLALGTPAEALAPPLPKADMIRALNFPDTAEDEEGFAALRRALKDRATAQLIQAAQDVLTLLSQDGIYMDDLPPDMARTEIWRRFATGERGRTIATLGGIRDRSSLALAAGRMKQDPIFRDAAHHFLRLFDRNFASFETDASDADISELANTRTARAFMLLGRVAGTFD